MSVLKAIRSSYFKYFFIHLPLLCLVFKRTTKVEADVIHLQALLRDRCCRAVAGAAPGPGSPRSALFGRAVLGLGLPRPAPRRQPRLCLRSAPFPFPVLPLAPAHGSPSPPCLPLPAPVPRPASCSRSCLPLPLPVLPPGPASRSRQPAPAGRRRQGASTSSSLSPELEAIKLRRCHARLGCNYQQTRRFLQHGGNHCKQSWGLLVRVRQGVRARSCSFYPYTSRLPFPLLLFWRCLHKHC